MARTTARNMRNFQKKKDTIVHLPVAFLHPFVAIKPSFHSQNISNR